MRSDPPQSFHPSMERLARLKYGEGVIFVCATLVLTAMAIGLY